MNRRQFNKALFTGVVALGMGKTAFSFADERSQIAVTIDDFNLFGASQAIAETRNKTLLDTLRTHSNLKVAVFPAGKHIDNDLGKSLLRAWGEAGHIVANHTYSHWFYPFRGFEEFSQDILREEALIKDLPGFTKRFRFPGLKEGDTVEKRDKMRVFLEEHQYRMGYVTIDASDWYIDRRLRERIAQKTKEALAAYKDYYLNHLWDRAVFYDNLSRKLLGRPIKHTLLIHHNALNEMFLSAVLDMFVSKDWKLINAEDAFTDSVFSSAPNILPAGESIIWALAKESGRFSYILRYPGEGEEYEKAKMDELGL